MDTSKPKRKATTLTEAVVAALRKELEESEARIRILSMKLRQYENESIVITRRVHAAEEDAVVMFDAIRILAAATSAETATGRRVRQEARQVLESREIVPPHTLGSSRNRPGKRRRLTQNGLDGTSNGQRPQ